MKLKLAIIGCGIKARQYIETWTQRDDLVVTAVADLDADALTAVTAISDNSGWQHPALYTDWQELLRSEATSTDAVYISSPHAYHAAQAIAALNANLDVLLEKPMVMNVAEAEAIIAAEQTQGRHLVVAYQGGLSPLTQELCTDVRKATYGELISVSATIWEDWAAKYQGHWKQQRAVSGGGFMFDTGAHMMNTVSMVCGADIQSISAYMDNRSYPVDAVTAAIGKLQNGTIITLHASGETIPVCESRLEFFFTEAIVRLCAWGRWIEIERPGKQIERKEQESAHNLLDIFNRVRSEEIPNPSPATQGLKMARLWDAIKASAAANGQVVDAH